MEQPEVLGDVCVSGSLAKPHMLQPKRPFGNRAGRAAFCGGYSYAGRIKGSAVNAIDASSMAAKLGAEQPARVLHISADFPDPFDGAKTPAVRWLVDLTSTDFRHQVMSINRVNPSVFGFANTTIAGKRATRRGVTWGNFPYGDWLTYEAPKFGLFHKTCLEAVADSICERLQDGSLPELVIGHKLTVEGVIARRISQKLRIPYAVGIMGDTDSKIVRARPDLSGLFASVFHDASLVYSLAPWSLANFEKAWGKRRGPVAMIPCATDADVPITPRQGGDGFITVFHLKNHARKNFRGLVSAYRIARARGVDKPLAVLGGGSAEHQSACREQASGFDGVIFEGAIARAELGPRLNRAIGFVLPSLRESFGMVFIESLYAGIPVIYPRGAAIDGYFDGLEFAVPVDARDHGAIAAAMAQLVERETNLKAALAEWQRSSHAAKFSRKAIAGSFSGALATAMHQL